MVSHTAGRKKTTTTFILDPWTMKHGSLKPGANATVVYRLERNGAVANTVEVQSTKAPTKSGTPPGGKVVKPKS